MKGLKGNRGLLISVGVLGLAIVGSGILYKRESDKAKRMKAEVDTARENLVAILNTVPTEKHKVHQETQKAQIEENYKKVLQEALRWNHVMEEVSGPTFHGQMLWKTIGIVSDAAKARQVIIGPGAKYLGFDEFAVATPRPDVHDILQLERELSAATDIVLLLIASDVYSIEWMVRGDEALTIEERTGPSRLRSDMETPTTAKKRVGKGDLYDTVPFRVRFSCTYPSLALFQRSLVTPGKVAVSEDGVVVRRPLNFLVANDLWFKVKQIGEGGSEITMAGALDRTRSATWALMSRGAPPELASIPGGLGLWETNKTQALWLLERWRKMTPEEKEIYRLTQESGQGSISEEQKQRLREQIERLRREMTYRKLEGRPPEYSIIQVTMLIDFVQFTDTMTAELEPKGSQPKGGTSPLAAAGR